MPKKKKDTAIVFCLTSNYIFAVGNILFDIKRFCSEWVSEVIVIYDGKLRYKDVQVMKSIFPTKFIEYDFPIKDTSKFNKLTYKCFTKMVYAKFECLKLLNEYHNVICLDYDIVITKDLKELVSFSEGNFKILLRGGNVGGQFHQPIPGYNMIKEGMCACTFALHDTLPNYIDIYNFCYSKVEELAKYLMHPEQGIFDLAIQEFNITTSVIPANWIVDVKSSESISIDNFMLIHSAGSYKFWHGQHNSQWNKNYLKWLKLGGSHARSLRPIKNLKRKIINFVHRLFKNSKKI